MIGGAEKIAVVTGIAPRHIVAEGKGILRFGDLQGAAGLVAAAVQKPVPPLQLRPRPGIRGIAQTETVAVQMLRGLEFDLYRDLQVPGLLDIAPDRYPAEKIGA